MTAIRYAHTPWHAYWRRWYGYSIVCWHRSHRLGLPCLRWSRYDHYCGKHNATCQLDDQR